MATTVNVTWVQGQDLDFSMIYQEGPNDTSLTPIDLSTGYAVRFDIIDPTSQNRLFTFNSADIADVDDATAGTQPDTVHEATLSSGAGGTSNIDISINRSLTLFGGELYSNITAGKLTFVGDIFLRNTVANKQWKILTVNITVEKSYTLWL